MEPTGIVLFGKKQYFHVGGYLHNSIDWIIYNGHDCKVYLSKFMQVYFRPHFEGGPLPYGNGYFYMDDYEGIERYLNVRLFREVPNP